MPSTTDQTDDPNIDATEDLNYVEQVKHFQNHVDDDLEDQYDTLLANGCAPRFAAATLEYVAGQIGARSPITQKEAADKYNTSQPTIRKWLDEIEDTIPPLTGVKNKPTHAPSTRSVFYTLYSSPDPFLKTAEVRNRSEFSSGTVGEALRALASAKAVGARHSNDGNRGKEWWAVPRRDSPEYRYERYDGEHTVADLVEMIAEQLEWDTIDYSDWSGEYKISRGGHSGSTGSIRHDGFADLTGEESTIKQMLALTTEYGLVLGSDMTLSLNLNKSGYQKVYDSVLVQNEEGTEGQNDE